MTMTIRLRPLFTLLTCVVLLSALLSAQGPLLTSSPTRAYASAGFTIAPTAGLSGTSATFSFDNGNGCDLNPCPVYYVMWDAVASSFPHTPAGPTLCSMAGQATPLTCSGVIPSAVPGTHTVYLLMCITTPRTTCSTADSTTFTVLPPPYNGPGGGIPWQARYTARFSAGVDAQVDLADGHADVRARDLALPARGPALALAHVWDSARAAAGVSTVAGQGWQTNLTPRLDGAITGTVTYLDASGATWPFTTTGSQGGVYGYTTPPGLPWQLVASTAGYTLTNILTGATQRFDGQGALRAAADADGNSNTLTAGPFGPTSAVNSGGRTLAFTYTTTYPSGLLSETASPLWGQGGASAAGSQHVTYGYNGLQLTALTQGAGTPDAVTTTFGYSGTQLTRVTTAANRVWTLGYDGQGRVSTLTSPVSGTAGQAGYTPAYTTQFTYSPGQTQVVVGAGTSGALTMTYTLDAQGEAVATTDVLGRRSSRAYDADHDVTSRTDANGNQTLNFYQYVGPNGSTGLVTQTVAPPIQPYSPLNTTTAQPTTRYSYDSANNLIGTVRPEGGATLYGYNAAHGVVTTTEKLAASGQWRGTINSYDPYGELTAVTDGRGVSGVSVSGSGVASLTGQASLYTRHQGYDSAGDLTSASTPPITTTLNGQTQTAVPVTTSYTYDGDGNQLSAVSANGATTTDAYDHLGRQITTTDPSVTLYDGTTTTPMETTQYDAAGNVVRTTNALGAVTTSSYDPLGRQVATTNPVSGTTLTTYNATEQVSTQDPQGNTTTNSYDAAGRLIQANDAVTGTVQYGYDAAGNTRAITTGDTSGNVIQVETRQYDALNRAIADTVAGPGGASPQTTTTRYDLDGNVYQVNQPTGTTTVNTYDLADQLVTSETDGAPVQSATHQNQTTYRYDLAGNQVETVDPAGRDTTTRYDADNRVTQSVDVTGTSTITTTSQDDPDGNTLQTTQTQSGTGAT